MNILIIEDEPEAVERLRMFLTRYETDVPYSMRILAVLDSVKDAVAWFVSQPVPDLVLVDIHLADGLSFEIFNVVQVSMPIIFTTAYDEYALHAFNVHSIAYLLKPFRYTDFTAALEKLERQKAYFSQSSTEVNEWKRAFQESLQETSASVRTMQKRYKTRFLLRIGEKIVIVQTRDISYVKAEGKIVRLVTSNGHQYIADQTLDELITVLDPATFFRISRKFIIQASSITEVSTYFNGRLALQLSPHLENDVLVSRERVRDFTAWLESA
jgi:two-component system, LytTR family, response regulator LytT